MFPDKLPGPTRENIVCVRLYLALCVINYGIKIRTRIIEVTPHHMMFWMFRGITSLHFAAILHWLQF